MKAVYWFGILGNAICRLTCWLRQGHVAAKIEYADITLETCLCCALERSRWKLPEKEL